MEKSVVPKATLGRLPLYLRYLRSLPEDTKYVSATSVAKALDLGEVLVRKDLGAISGQGRPKVGYTAEGLIASLEHFLGFDNRTPAVLVGAGRLGRALLEYDEFEDYGVRIVAAFDCDERRIGPGPGVEIYPVERLESFCKENGVRIGIITVGASSAQQVCDQMVKSGIGAIWNFAPCALRVPKGVLLKRETLALSLAHLNHQLCNPSL